MTTRIARFSRIALASGMLAVACRPFDATVSQPSELTGRWARLSPNQTWSDTVVLAPNGAVFGASPASDTDDLRWSVVRSRVAGRALCLGPARAPHCQPYRLEGDTLVVGRLPTPTFFRRAQ